MTPITQEISGLEKRVRKWLAKNETAIGSSDGYPAEFHRQILFSLVEPGSKVAWLLPERPGDNRPVHFAELTPGHQRNARQIQTGSVRILTRGSHAACLITGSSGARPGLVDVRNIVWCDKAPAKL